MHANIYTQERTPLVCGSFTLPTILYAIYACMDGVFMHNTLCLHVHWAAEAMVVCV